MSTMFPTIGAIASLCFIWGFGPARPEVPESLKAPASEGVILMGHATGVQRLECQAESSTKKSAWVLKAPEAELTDATGKQNRASLRGTGTEADRWSRGAPTPRTTLSTRRLSSADSESPHITSRRRVETAPNKKDCGILRHEAMTTWQREERHPDPLPCRVRRKTCP